MPKNPRNSQRRNNNYNGHDGYGRNQNWLYTYENQNSYRTRHYEEYDVGYNSNYRNRWQKPRDVDEGSYSRNYPRPNWQKNWKSRPNNKQGYVEQNKRRAGENENNKPHQTTTTSDTNKLIAALDKTAEAVTTNKSSDTRLNRLVEPTISKVQTVEKGQPVTTVLNDSIHKTEEAIATKQPRKVNLKEILEEVEVNYKSARYAQKVEEHRENGTYTDTTVKVNLDEATLKEMDLHQALKTKEREELIQQTKKTHLYKVYKEKVKETVPSQAVLKTPDVSIAASRWKENYFKPWKLDLAQFGYRFLDKIEWEDDDNMVDQ